MGRQSKNAPRLIVDLSFYSDTSPIAWRWLSATNNSNARTYIIMKACETVLMLRSLGPNLLGSGRKLDTNSLAVNFPKQPKKRSVRVRLTLISPEATPLLFHAAKRIIDKEGRDSVEVFITSLFETYILLFSCGYTAGVPNELAVDEFDDVVEACLSSRPGSLGSEEEDDPYLESHTEPRAITQLAMPAQEKELEPDLSPSDAGSRQAEVEDSAPIQAPQPTPARVPEAQAEKPHTSDASSDQLASGGSEQPAEHKKTTISPHLMQQLSPREAKQSSTAENETKSSSDVGEKPNPFTFDPKESRAPKTSDENSKKGGSGGGIGSLRVES